MLLFNAYRWLNSTLADWARRSCKESILRTQAIAGLQSASPLPLLLTLHCLGQCLGSDRRTARFNTHISQFPNVAIEVNDPETKGRNDDGYRNELEIAFDGFFVECKRAGSEAGAQNSK